MRGRFFVDKLIGNNFSYNNIIMYLNKALLAYLIINMLFPYRIEAQMIAKGKLIDTVKCIDHPGYSYSLYMPSNYLSLKKWPAILIFDPGGQGTVAVGVFRKAAEKYGYIVACSNNSRNGPLNNNFTAAGNMLTDLLKRFTLDEKRIYAAGFSGGSRIALALASSNNFITGVIGCGAGFPNDRNLYPSKKSSFVYYGIAGNMDMNWLEMFDLMTFFNNNTSVIPYLRTFDGGHQWPSPEIIQEAVEWINLQAMKKKIVASDSAYISSYSNKTKTFINNLIATGNQYDAARYLQYAIRDFSGTQVSRDMTKSLTALEQSRNFNEANRQWSIIAAQEKSREENYISSIGKIVYSGNVPDSAGVWWKREIGSLKMIKNQGIPTYSQMAARLLNFISILCSEQGTAYFHQKQYDLSGFFFELCTLSDSENMNNYYNLARSLSGSNKKGEALDELNKAVGHGLNSRKTIELEPAFNNIRNEGKFKSLLMRMK
jgi:predicted esterase